MAPACDARLWTRQPANCISQSLACPTAMSRSSPKLGWMSHRRIMIKVAQRIQGIPTWTVLLYTWLKMTLCESKVVRCRNWCSRAITTHFIPQGLSGYQLFVKTVQAAKPVPIHFRCYRDLCKNKLDCGMLLWSDRLQILVKISFGTIFGWILHTQSHIVKVWVELIYPWVSEKLENGSVEENVHAAFRVSFR